MAQARTESAAPATEPLTTAEAKTHLRHQLDSTDTTEDALIDRLIAAARRYAEAYVQRSLVTTTWIEYYDTFPDVFEPERAPLIDVTTLKYYDVDGTLQTLVEGTDYQVDTDSLPGRIAPEPGETWPSVETDRQNAVVLTYTAGFGAASAVPEDIKAALLLLVGHLYEHREQASDEKKFAMPFAAENLLAPHRLMNF